MNLQTIVELPKSKWEINHQHRMILMGSCFASNIGSFLEKNKFDILLNPYGIQYNPISMMASIDRCIDLNFYNIDDLNENQGFWHSFDHHGDFSAKDPGTVLESINENLKEFHHYLHTGNYLFFTLGTAWSFFLKGGLKPVNNCHKFPQSQFERRQLTLTEITLAFKNTLSRLKELNPTLKFGFTVSPIRHWKDGAIENQLSKSLLTVALHQVIQYFDVNDCCYFPAYEIMMDELRDYRFYEDDMLHPTPLAQKIILGKFCELFMDGDTKSLMNELEKLNKAYIHRSINPNSIEHKNFLKKMHESTKKISQLYPKLNFEKELSYFSNYNF